MLFSGQIFDNTYQIMNPIGQGGTGTVFLAYHLRLQKYVVIKQIGVGGKMPPRNEVDTLKSLHHPNLPQVYDFLQEPDAVYTVMDYVQGTDLEHYLKEGYEIPAEDLQRWFRQLTEVLKYLHEQPVPVIHSDIKPANIIITPDNQPVLIDFNISLNQSNARVMGMSLDYASPEQIELAQYAAKGLDLGFALDGRSDIYSLCATFYELITYQRPSVFYPNEPLSADVYDYPAAFLEIIEKGMNLEQEERFQTAREMLKACENSWKKEKKYKLYVLLQVLLVLVSTALIGTGIFFTVSGGINAGNTKYQDARNECIEALNYHQMGAERMVNAFRRDYGRRLEKDPETEAMLLLKLGDYLYDEQFYDGAIAYYKEAAELYSKRDPEGEAICYISAISAYAAMNDLNGAENMLAVAELKGASIQGKELLKIQILSMKKDAEDCISATESLIQNGGNPELLAEACLMTADALSGDERCRAWIDLGRNYADTAAILRHAGALYAGLARNAVSEAQIRADLEQAMNCYRMLTESPDRTSNDHINLAVILCALGEYQKSIQELEILKIQDPDNGLIYMHEAFAYEGLSNSSEVRRCLSRAKETLRRDKVSADDLERFDRLYAAYFN